MIPIAHEHRHLGNLDGLRGYAVLIVLVSHISNDKAITYKSLGQGFGQTGVMIFFALSGFLMAYLYLDRPYTSENVSNFALRRAARVLPLYFAVVLASVILTEFAPNGPQLYGIAAADVLPYLMLWNADYVLWTIPVEVQFYCLFPAFWYVRAKAGVSAAISAGLLVLLLHGFLNYSTVADAFSLLPVVVPKLHFFVAGLLVYVAFSRLTPIGGVGINLLFGVSLALSILMAPNIFKALLGQNRDMWGSGQMLLVVVVLLYTSILSPYATAIFGNQVARFYGAISYSLYMLHVPCMIAIKRYTRLDDNGVTFALSTILLSTAVAYCSYRLLEVPARQWLTRRDRTA